MQRFEILEKLKEILNMLEICDEDTVAASTEASTLTGDLALNSVGILCVVIAVEELFGISFENVSFSSFVTVGDVIDYIESKQ